MTDLKCFICGTTYKISDPNVKHIGGLHLHWIGGLIWHELVHTTKLLTIKSCPKCKGFGKMIVNDGKKVTHTICPRCGGYGIENENKDEASRTKGNAVKQGID